MNCNGISLVIAKSTDISENYLVTLRNVVPKQEGDWENTALFAIFDNAIDSVFDGMGNLADSGKPLNINYISKNLENEIKSSKNLGKPNKEIIKFSINNLKEDLFQTTIWDYKNILSIIKSEQITPKDLFELKLFPDRKLKNYNAQKMQSRLKKNYDLFDDIETCKRYGDEKEELKKKFSDRGVKVLMDEEWYLTDYNDIENFKKPPSPEPIHYEENFEKITPEGLIYWEKPLSSKPAGRRKRQIIVFNDNNVSSVSFDFAFDKRTKKEFLSRNTERITTTSGKKLHVEFEVSPIEPTFKQISYKHNNENNSHYIFNILVLNSTQDVFDSIKSRYNIAFNKKLLVITNDEENEDIIFGVGDNLIETEIEDKNEKIFLYDDDSILISEASPAWEEESLNFELNYKDNKLQIEINESSKKPVPVKSAVIWNLKRQNMENFTYNGGKAIQGVNRVYLEDKFKDYLNLERQIIKNDIFYGIKEIDGTIKKQDVVYSDEITNAYAAIFEYYKTFDDTPEDNLPSLVYLNDELKELYENFMEIFNREISEIQENDVLADFKYKKDLIKLGRIDDDKRIMYSSLSPINIAYQLEIINQCKNDEIANKLAERLVPNNLVPYIYSDTDELYRPIHQEDAHEWLVYEKSEDVSIGTTNVFISNVVKEKLSQFVNHFNYLFEINNNSPIKINLINLNDDIEVVKGVFNFIRERLPDKFKTKEVIPVEINIYNDSDRSSFETLYDCDSKEKLNEIFGIKIKSDLLDEIDVLHAVQSNITYYHHSLNTKVDYAHISFYKVNSGVQAVFENMDKMETGISLNGLISTVASTTKHSDYRTGFGTKNVLDKEDLLVKSAININELIENSKMQCRNPYSKNKSVVTSITLDDENIEELYKKSHWITFIEPTFGIEYFDNSNNIVIVHYSDQYTSSNKYDTITVTDKSTQYEDAILRFLNDKNIQLLPEQLNSIIRMFNSINGEWLLQLAPSSGEDDRVKLSLISAVKYGLALFDHKDIIWVPISLEEILRITKNLKLDKAKGSISPFIKQGSYNDDLLFIGLKINDEDNLEVIYYPTEVKIGKNDGGVIKKGKSQIDNTYQLLHKLFDGNSSKFINKFFRNFFIQLFLSNQKKFFVNEIWNEKEFERIEKFKSKLLNDEYTIIYDLEDYIGKGSLFSFKSSCDFPSIKFEENKQIIELPEEWAYDSLDKSTNEIWQEIQSEESEFPLDKLLSSVNLDNIERRIFPSIDDDEDDSDDISDDGGSDDKDSPSDVAPEDLGDDTEDFLDDPTEVPEPASTISNSSVDLEDVRALIGTAEGSTHEIYWEFGSSEVNNRHLLIQGASGYGKSYFIQKMLKELSNQGIPSVIIDYTEGFKKSKLESDFKESMSNKIEYHSVYVNKFPLNPFKRHFVEVDDEFVPGDNVSIAGRFKNVIDSVYGFGSQQEIEIYNAVLSGLSKYDEEMDLIKFKEELSKRDSSHAKSALNKLTQFLDINPFKTEDFDWSCLDERDGKIRIIQLTGFSKDIQLVITEFILLDLWNYKSNVGDEDLPFIVVLDEAQNLEFSNKDSPGYKILKEGRKFGWSGWFATQFLKGAMKSDEINTLENASEKIYFHPTDNSISDIAGNISKDGDKKHWEKKLSKLNKGQCIVHGHLRNSDGDVYSAEPVCVDISEIGMDKIEIDNNSDQENNNETNELPEASITNGLDNQSSNLDYDSNDEDMKFIRKNGNNFEIYKIINGVRKFYGSFDNLFDAQNRRNELLDDNWGYSTDELPAPGRKPKYGKYIIYNNGFFKISKFIDGQQRYIGKFDSFEKAKELREYLIKNHWDLSLLPQEMLDDKRIHNIRKIRGRFLVFDNDKKFYDSFDTYEEAKEYLDYLIENNWEINDNIEEEKIDDFVYLINGKYVVRNEIDGELKIFGEFDDMNEALRYRIECMRKAWKL